MAKVKTIRKGLQFTWGKLSYVALETMYNSHAIMAYCLETQQKTLIWHNAKLQWEF